MNFIISEIPRRVSDAAWFTGCDHQLQFGYACGALDAPEFVAAGSWRAHDDDGDAAAVPTCASRDDDPLGRIPDPDDDDDDDPDQDGYTFDWEDFDRRR